MSIQLKLIVLFWCKSDASNKCIVLTRSRPMALGSNPDILIPTKLICKANILTTYMYILSIFFHTRYSCNCFQHMVT